MTTQQTRDFVLAGRAIFTISNGKPGADARDYTYRVSKKAARDGNGHVYFVALLTGSDNENDYTYLGLLNAGTGGVRTTAKSAYLPTSAPVVAINWALGRLFAGRELPNGASLQHAGKCGKCARTLTVPESIECGLGPECSGNGYTKPRNERKPRVKKAAKPTFAEQRAAATVTDPANFSLGLAAEVERAAGVGGEIDPEYDRSSDYDGTLDANEARYSKPFVSQSPYAGRQIAEAR